MEAGRQKTRMLSLNMSDQDLRAKVHGLGWTMTNPLDLLPAEIPSPAAHPQVAAMAQAIGPEIESAEDSAVNMTIAGALAAAKLAGPGIGRVIHLRDVARFLERAHGAVLAAAEAVEDNLLAQRGPARR
jgi:hypothetical protein